MPSSSNRTRLKGIAHRVGVAAADKLAAPIQISALTDQTEAGSTLANSAMNCTVSAGNRWGSTPVPTVQTTTPTLNHALRATIAQVANAEWYDIFLSTGANPLWVGRITEAQRAAGGFIISTVGTVTLGGGATAGQVDLGIVGTGLASNVNPFAVNNAYTPALATPIIFTECEIAHIMWKLTVTDLRTLPTLALAIFLGNQLSPTDFHLASLPTTSLLTATGLPLEGDIRLAVDGASQLAVLVDSIAGTGAALNVWVELC